VALPERTDLARKWVNFTPILAQHTLRQNADVALARIFMDGMSVAP
jgi:hypothetical protein